MIPASQLIEPFDGKKTNDYQHMIANLDDAAEKLLKYKFTFSISSQLRLPSLEMVVSTNTHLINIALKEASLAEEISAKYERRFSFNDMAICRNHWILLDIIHIELDFVAIVNHDCMMPYVKRSL